MRTTTRLPGSFKSCRGLRRKTKRLRSSAIAEIDLVALWLHTHGPVPAAAVTCTDESPDVDEQFETITVRRIKAELAAESSGSKFLPPTSCELTTSHGHIGDPVTLIHIGEHFDTICGEVSVFRLVADQKITKLDKKCPARARCARVCGARRSQPTATYKNLLWASCGALGGSRRGRKPDCK